MATCSILNNVKLTKPEDVEKFINALELSENDPAYDSSAPKYEFVTDKEKIMQILNKWCIEDDK